MLVTASHPVIVTAALVVLVTLAVAVSIFLTKLLHDALPSHVRSGVSSGIGALTWAAFLPFALGFGWASDVWGIRPAGWLFVGVAAAVGVLLVFVVTADRRHLTTTALVDADGEVYLAAA